MLIVMASPKVKMVNVRLTPSVHEAFRIAAELRGASMSSLLHQFIVRTIREERELDPRAFVLKAEPGRLKADLRHKKSEPPPIDLGDVMFSNVGSKKRISKKAMQEDVEKFKDKINK